MFGWYELLQSPITLSQAGAWLSLFILVLARLSGLAVLAPIYGSAAVPWKIRGLLAITLALLICPVQWGQTPTLAPWDLIPALVSELALGMALGWSVAVLLGGVRMAGQWASQVCGMNLTDSIPDEEFGGSPVGQLYSWVALASYVAFNGHLLLLGGLLNSFTDLPPGRAMFAAPSVEVLATMMNHSFQLALCGAVGFSLLIGVTLLALSSSLGGHVNLFLEYAVEAVPQVLRSAVIPS